MPEKTEIGTLRVMAGLLWIFNFDRCFLPCIGVG